MSNYEEIKHRALSLIHEDKYGEAFTYLEQCRDRGEVEAYTVFGMLHYFGIGVEQNFNYGEQLLRKAIDLGSADAAKELGCNYFYGIDGLDVPIDKEKGLELIKLGAERGNATCHAVLGLAYFLGNGVSPDFDKAFYHAQIAANMGDETGIGLLADLYQEGWGTDPDPAAAYHWSKEYLKIVPDSASKMVSIAECLSDPNGIYGINPTQDMLEEAFYYAAQAVELGDIRAHLLVGYFYETGKGVQKDYDLAHHYLKIAADSGDDVAINRLRHFRKDIYGNYYVHY